MNALSSESDRLKNLSDEEARASAEALAHQRTAEHATKLIAEAHTTNMRKLDMRNAAKEGLTGAVGFEHTYNYTEGREKNINTSLVFMTPDPASGTIQVRVSGYNSSINGEAKNVNGAFSITADGKFEKGSLVKNDPWHRAILDDATAQVNNGLNLRNTPGGFSEKVEKRWAISTENKQIVANIVAETAAEHLRIPPPQAAAIGNALTGAEPNAHAGPDELKRLLDKPVTSPAREPSMGPIVKSDMALPEGAGTEDLNRLLEKPLNLPVQKAPMGPIVKSDMVIPEGAGAEDLNRLLENPITPPAPKTPAVAERDTAHLLREEAKLGQAAEHASLVSKFGKVAGKAILPLGVAIAATEANAKDGIAQEAVTKGTMSPEALNQYRGIQAAQLTTLADPTVVGGEMAVQKTYAAFADAHHLDPQLREALRPSALSDLVPEVKTITLDQKQKAFFDTFDRLPDKPQQDMPPEVESLVEAKGMVRQGEANLTAAQNASPGAMDKTRSLSEAQRGLDTAQTLYQEQYDTLEKSGQLKETVKPWLEANTVTADAKPPALAASTPEAKPEEKYTVKPPAPAPAPA